MAEEEKKMHPPPLPDTAGSRDDEPMKDPNPALFGSEKRSGADDDETGAQSLKPPKHESNISCKSDKTSKSRVSHAPGADPSHDIGGGPSQQQAGSYAVGSDGMASRTPKKGAIRQVPAGNEESIPREQSPVLEAERVDEEDVEVGAAIARKALQKIERLEEQRRVEEEERRRREQEIQQAAVVDQNQGCVQLHRVWALAALAIVGIIVGVVMVLVPNKDPTQTSAPTPYETSQSPTVGQTLAPTHSDIDRTKFILEILDDTFKKANNSKAYRWITKLDLWGEPGTDPAYDDEQIWINRYIMAILYYETNGDDWPPGRNTNWISPSKSVCEWYIGYGKVCGVNETTSHIVKEIWLTSSSLSGRMPTELALLQNLTTLNLESNYRNLVGSIPVEYCQLTDLERLDLSKNALGGSIPSCIGDLTKLTMLDLENNDFAGQIPSTIGALKNLIHLDLSNNALTSQIPTSIGQLTNLERLDLERMRGNALTGIIPSEVGLLNATLQHLDLGPNGLTGEIPSSIGALTNLTLLGLEHNDLTGTIPSGIGDMTAISRLNMRGNKFTPDTIPEEVVALAKALNLKGDERDRFQIDGLKGAILRSLLFDMVDGQFHSAAFEWLANTDEWRGKAYRSPETETVNVWAQRYALGAFYYDTGYENGRWLTGGSVCTWSSTLCDDPSSNLVTKLALGRKGLSGTLPTEIALLRNLTLLNMESNTNLKGSIPSEYCQLTALRRFDVSEDALTGSIPPCIGNWTKLSWFDVEANAITGAIPSTIGALTELTHFDLGPNSLSKQIPTEIGHLTLLEKLDLEENFLTGIIPSEIAQLKSQLVHLDLGPNRLAGAIPSGIAKLTKLTWLSLESNGLTGPIPAAIGNLGSLSRLLLDLNELDGEIPSEIGALTALTLLNLTFNALSGTIPRQVSDLRVGTTIDIDSMRTGTLKYLLGGVVGGPFHEEAFEWLSEVDTFGKPGMEYAPEAENVHVWAQRYALAALYFETGGNDRWDQEESWNWLSPESVCTWHGPDPTSDLIPSFCANSSSHLLTRLSLRLNVFGFEGSLPTELGLLHSSLAYLSLASSRLSGTMPTELALLSSLTTLNLENNLVLGGSIPHEYCQLTTLERLDISGNVLDGSMPPCIGDLTKLSWLDLESNEITGAIPSTIGSLTKLTRLDLGPNSLSNRIPTEFRRLTLLKWLDLEENSLTGGIPLEIGQLNASLVHLDLGPNRLTSEIPMGIGALTKLTWLSLEQNLLTGTIPTSVGNLGKLTRLLLDSNTLDGDIPSEIGVLSALTLLNLTFNALSGTIPPEVMNLKESGTVVDIDTNINESLGNETTGSDT